MTSKPTAREELERIKFKLVISDESYSKYDDVEDISFLVKLVEAAVGLVGNKCSDQHCVKEYCDDHDKSLWKEIEQRMAQGEKAGCQICKQSWYRHSIKCKEAEGEGGEPNV